jgi:prepilin-type N-terminal cleavage/methylation domain-containing protein
MNRRRGGFTLIELMIVVAIVGILAAIAVPKFAELIRKSSEGASKGNLASVRSALTVYYGDMEGQYPAQVSALTLAGKYLTLVPRSKIPSYHAETSAETDGVISAAAADAGDWYYDNVVGDSGEGTLIVDCTHTDTQGLVWTSY